MSDFYVYCYTNLINRKRYFGKGIGDRINDHWKKQGSTLLSQAIAKHGIAAFKVFKLYEGLTEAGAFAMERDCIARYRTNVHRYGWDHGYNQTDGGEGASGLRQSEDARARIATYRRGRRHSAEARRKMSAANIGLKRQHTPATRQRISEQQRGRKRGPYRKRNTADEGRAHSPTTDQCSEVHLAHEQALG